MAMNPTFRLFAHQHHDHAVQLPELTVHSDGSLIGLAVLIGGAVAVLIAVLLIVRLLRKGRPAAGVDDGMPAIDVKQLPLGGPPAAGPQLECYHVPMRLALLVLAPAGRGGEIPPNDELPELVDAIAPHLMQVLAGHQPQFHRWPPQLSSQGFSQTFFSKAPLPDGGKSTPWCSLAGRFVSGEQPYLAGMILVADRPNAFGQVAVQRETQWLDILRVKLA